MKYNLVIIIFLLNSIFCYSQDTSIRPYKVLKGHKHKVQDAYFSTDGKFIISYGWDNTRLN